MAYSEYAMENINIEESKIKFEDKWYSLEELKIQMKNRVNSDDYNVAPLASAIQELSQVLNNISSVKLTLHVDVINSYKEQAQNSSEKFENLLRNALISRVDYGLTSNMSQPVSSPGASAGEGAASDYKPKKVACRECRSVIVVDSPKRPITITCPECGAQGKLSK